MEDSSAEHRILVVGIDFGTTYSGIAYGQSNIPDLRVACVSWPNQFTKEGGSGQKAPTTLRYLPRQQTNFEWGFQIGNSVHPDEVFRWFKLGLQSARDRPADLQTMLADHDTDRLVRDYLSGLGEHTMYFLSQTLGTAMVQRYVERSALRFVLTVPAVWSELAKHKTLQAFQKVPSLSGLGGVTMVSEPEAAATFSLHTMAQDLSLKIGQTFIVLDAGGGTADLITYTIVDLHPVLQVREAAKGSGGLCGGAFVDEAFKAHLQAALGHEDAFDNEVLGVAVQAFESGPKRKFSTSSIPNGTSSVPVFGMANNPELGIRNGRLHLRASDIYSMFEPVVLQIIRVAKEQIHSANVPIDAVVLVGGFGTSLYLRERLKDEIEDKENIPLRFTPQSQLAVVLGAVMKGLADAVPQEDSTFPKVLDRKARSKHNRLESPDHYGVELGVPYKEELHRDLYPKRYWDGLDGCWRVKVMDWFIRSGEHVAESKPYFHKFHHDFKVLLGRPDIINIQICVDSDSDGAPLERNRNVRTLCRLEADLNPIPTSQFRVRRGHDGLDYYRVRCEIEVVCKSASTDYTLIHDNQRYKTVTAEYA
ncbi:uncharacterized protein PG986_001203 [Apiospora aurea]|uniref:Uncharacterized protein n=1 Tax=Apiospora aurea TaxID=335848 RepID=A0ABR1QW59_9PEZI